MIIKNIENNTIYIIQELLLHFVELILIKLVSSIFSLHSSINLSISLFLHLQFFWSKCSPKSKDLSDSHLQFLGLQIYPLSINSLHSHDHLSLFHRCLSLQTLSVCNDKQR